MKHEYTDDELAELKSIYDESGEAGLQIGEMRALRKAGLLTQDLPPKPHEDTLADHQAISVPKPKPKPEPVKLESTNTNRNPEMRQAVYDTIASFCDSGHVPTIQKIADAMHKSKSTVANHMLALAKEGRISKDPETGRYRTTNPTEKNTEKKESTIMTVTVQEQPEAKPEEPRAIIANALVGIFDAVSALQRTAFQANDKVVYGFATKLLNGELMDIKANYSKDAK